MQVLSTRFNFADCGPISGMRFDGTDVVSFDDVDDLYEVTVLMSQLEGLETAELRRPEIDHDNNSFLSNISTFQYFNLIQRVLPLRTGMMIKVGGYEARR
jgi:hypothetical protein